MSNLDKDNKNILIGTVIGGILGICAASLFLASRRVEKERKFPLSSIGRIVVQIGEMLDKDEMEKTPFISDIEKKAHKHEDAISDILQFISAGVHLWDKIKRG